MIRPKDDSEYKALMTWAKLQVHGKKRSGTYHEVRMYTLPPFFADPNKNQVCSIEWNPTTGEINRITIDEVIYNV